MTNLIDGKEISKNLRDQLKNEIDNNPEKFTVWLKIMIKNYFKYFEHYENNSL